MYMVSHCDTYVNEKHLDKQLLVFCFLKNNVFENIKT